MAKAAQNTSQYATSSNGHSAWWTGQVAPQLTMIAFGFPIAHTFTFLSSPPVAMTEPDLRPICRQLTAEPCATNSWTFVAFVARIALERVAWIAALGSSV